MYGDPRQFRRSSGTKQPVEKPGMGLADGVTADFLGGRQKTVLNGERLGQQREAAYAFRRRELSVHALQRNLDRAAEGRLFHEPTDIVRQIVLLGEIIRPFLSRNNQGHQMLLAIAGDHRLGDRRLKR
jgi:hypothetical protein